jgi:Domain of unknown function (4846)
MLFSFFKFHLFLAMIVIKPNNRFETINDIPLPPDYVRISVDPNSFGAFLRESVLKKDKTVYLFDGRPKQNQTAQYAVLDISTGSKDLQQCADAVMRLRAEYLKLQNRPICFADNADINYCWNNYRHKGWQSYLETVFGMCGTISLQKQLKPQKWENLLPGDVIIKGGSPGHAVIVMDIAKHKSTGKLIFLLAQSYMPAQDMHVLLNKNESKLNPWYSIPYSLLETPEWAFTSSQLRTWP